MGHDSVICNESPAQRPRGWRAALGLMHPELTLTLAPSLLDALAEVHLIRGRSADVATGRPRGNARVLWDAGVTAPIQMRCSFLPLHKPPPRNPCYGPRVPLNGRPAGKVGREGQWGWGGHGKNDDGGGQVLSAAAHVRHRGPAGGRAEPSECTSPRTPLRGTRGPTSRRRRDEPVKAAPPPRFRESDK